MSNRILNIYSNRQAIVGKGLGGKLFDVVKFDSLNGIIKKMCSQFDHFVLKGNKHVTT